MTYRGLEEAEGRIAELERALRETKDAVSSTLASQILSWKGNDWNEAPELIGRGKALVESLDAANVGVSRLRDTVHQFIRAAEVMRVAVDQLAETPPTIGEAVNAFVEEAIKNGIEPIEVNSVLAALEHTGVNLSVRNPAAVVASLLGRHPNVKRQSKGVFVARKHEDEGPAI